MGMLLPFTSLNAATATGAGSSADLNGVSNEFTVFVTTTGSPTSWRVQLQMSHDNVNWFAHPQINITETTASALASSTISLGEQVVNSPDAVYMPHARYVRANLVSFSGGTAPTFTASIAVGRVF